MSTRRERRWARRARKGIRVMRFRWFKNLLWWLTGVISSFVILAGTIFVGIKVLPLKTYFGEQTSDYVSDEISDKSLIDALLGIGSNKLGDIPIVAETLKSLMTDSGLNSYFTVDYDRLNNVKFTYENGETDFATELQGCITVTATLDSIGGAELLGDLGTLSVFSQVEKVLTPPDTTADDFNAKLYYYQTDDGTFARAFDNAGVAVAEASGKQLYYPALSTVPLVDMIDIMSDRMSMMTVKSLLESFGEVSDDNVIVNILGDRTVKDVGTFKSEEILLKDVLNETEDNQTVFDILCEAVVVPEGTEKPTSDEINLGHIENIEIDKVPLIKIIENKTEENHKLYDVLCSALSTDEITVTPEEVVVGDLKVLDTDDIELISVLPYEAKSVENPEGKNVMLYNILLEATNKTDPSELKVTDLNGFQVNNVKLTTVLPEEESNKNLYNILKDLYETDDASTITIDNLHTFQLGEVKLETVFTRDGHEELYTVIDSAMPGVNTSELTIQEFEDDFKVENIGLFDIIKDPVEEDYSTPEEFNDAKKKHDNLKAILCDATGKTAEEIHVSDIENGFDVSKIRLVSVLDKETVTNPILKTLLNDETVTISALGERIDELSLHDVYGESCFVLGGTGTDKYVKTELPDGKEVYTLDNANGTYTRSTSTGIWLLMCYDSVDSNGDGKTDVYTECDLTVKDLQDGGNTISSRISGATIQQLIDAGIVSGTNISNQNLLKSTMQQVLEAVDEYGDLIFGN